MRQFIGQVRVMYVGETEGYKSLPSTPHAHATATPPRRARKAGLACGAAAQAPAIKLIPRRWVVSALSAAHCMARTTRRSSASSSRAAAPLREPLAARGESSCRFRSRCEVPYSASHAELSASTAEATAVCATWRRRRKSTTKTEMGRSSRPPERAQESPGMRTVEEFAGKGAHQWCICCLTRPRARGCGTSLRGAGKE